jgi:hypothetical protein
MFKIENYYSATVIDNKDPDKEGKIKVFCDVFMSGISEDLYPWVRPWSPGPGGAKDFGSSNIPEKDSQVMIFFSNDELKHHGYYVADASFKDLNSAKAFETKVKPKVGRWASEYPDTKFMIHKNGTCIAMSSSSDNPEIVIVSPNGAQFLIDKHGNLFAGKNSNRMDPVVSTSKLKNYLMPIIGNLGGPLFAATVSTADISFTDFFGGIDPSISPPSFVPPAPPDATIDEA